MQAYVAGGSRHAARLSKPLRFGKSCGCSDDAAEVMLQRPRCREYVGGVTLRGYGAGITLQGVAVMLHEFSNTCVLESLVGAVTMLRR